MRIRKLIGVIIAVLLLAVCGISVPVFALAAGSYIAPNTTYYINPDTGVPDDGGDTSIGEGMCRNAVYTDSFYELKDGKHYVTVRLKLISFIRNIQFRAQLIKDDGNSYQEVGYTVTGENPEENTKDFRLELPAPDTFLNLSFFVGPMNRDVTFFMKLNADLAKEDDGSFAAFNNPAPQQPAPEAAAEEQKSTPAGEAAEPDMSAASGAADPAPAAPEKNPALQAQEKLLAERGETGNKDTEEPALAAPASVLPAQAAGEEEKVAGEIPGITEYTARGEAVPSASSDGETENSLGALIALVALGCLAVLGSAVFAKKGIRKA